MWIQRENLVENNLLKTCILQKWTAQMYTRFPFRFLFWKDGKKERQNVRF